MSLELVKYEAPRKAEWNAFLGRCKNGLFMYNRDFVEYHKDRFQDHSLMVYNKGKLTALLPANFVDATARFASHGGLTFGGLLIDSNMKTPLVMRIFEAMVAYWNELGAKSILYKPTPHIYHQIPSEEDLYALFRFGFQLKARNISTSIINDLEVPAYSKRRKRSLKKVHANTALSIESNDLEGFMGLVGNRLGEKYDTAAVHSYEEIAKLKELFPDNIKLYNAVLDGELVAGTLVFESKRVAHTQYIASNDVGRSIGGLDFVFDHLIKEVYATKPVFDFGTSNENSGLYLNESLVENKESYGARAIAYDIYELTL